MYSLQYSNGSAMADDALQFGTSRVWGSDPPPLGEPKCMVLWTTDDAPQFGTSGVWGLDPLQ